MDYFLQIAKGRDDQLEIFFGSVAEFNKYKGCLNKKLDSASKVALFIPSTIATITEKLNNLISQFRNCISDVCNVMVSNNLIKNFTIFK